MLNLFAVLLEKIFATSRDTFSKTFEKLHGINNLITDRLFSGYQNFGSALWSGLVSGETSELFFPNVSSIDAIASFVSTGFLVLDALA